MPPVTRSFSAGLKRLPGKGTTADDGPNKQPRLESAVSVYGSQTTKKVIKKPNKKDLKGNGPVDENPKNKNSEGKEGLDTEAAPIDDAQIKQELYQVQQETQHVKEQVAELMYGAQGRIGAIRSATEKQNHHMYQTLSTVGKCLQDLGSLIERAVEEQGPATVKVNSDFTHGRLPLGPTHYFPWLASLDFRSPEGMDKYLKVTFQFYETELFTVPDKLDPEAPAETYYMIHNNSKYLPPLVKKARAEGGAENAGDDDDVRSVISSSSMIAKTQAYLDHIIEMKPQTHPTGRNKDEIPQYILPLGHLMVHTPACASEKPYPTSWTGFHVVMDVATPAKALWLVYCAEGEEQTATDDDRFPDWLDRLTNSRKRNVRCDIVRLTARADWLVYTPASQITARIVKSAWKHSHRAQPVFTVPKLDELLERIEAGWKDHEDDVAPLTTDIS